MITIKNWMEAVNFRITEGGEYGWQCYGPNAYDLSSWDGDHDGVSSNILFDTDTQEVYEVTVCDYANQRAYRLINPLYIKKHDQEAAERGASVDQAWDDVKYNDLELDEDMLAKLNAIMNYEDYDTRISVPIELPDDELFQFMKLAHEQDITLNQLVERALKTAIEEVERDPEGYRRKAREFARG